MVKPVLSGREGDDDAREIARTALERCLADSVALAHPFMPFLTEEIWEKLTGRPGTLIVSPYPEGDPEARDPLAERAVERLRALVTRVRNFGGERRVSPAEPVSLSVESSPGETDEIRSLESLLRRLARLSELRFGPAGDGARRDVVSGVAVGLELPAGTTSTDREGVERRPAQGGEESGELAATPQNPAFLERATGGNGRKTRRGRRGLEERGGGPGGAA